MRCLYMSGAGNDFMVVDGRGQNLNYEQLSQKLCAMTNADGFMALDVSDKADFRLHYYNADGSRGEMCGNGSRCICKFAYELGIVGDTMTVETDAGIVYGWYLGGEQYRIRLNLPGLVDLDRRPDAAYVELGDPGIPHSVTQVPGFSWKDKESLRPKFLDLRQDKVFPKGVNVNIYCFLLEDTVQILTFERGVEDFTLACGTGSAAVAVVCYYQGTLPGNRLYVENPGGTLEISIEEDGKNITALYLEGPAEYKQ